MEARIGSFSSAGNMSEVANFFFTHLPPGVIGIGVAIALQRWYNVHFLQRATRFVNNAVQVLTDRLAGQGAIRAGGRVAVRVLGAIARVGAKCVQTV